MKGEGALNKRWPASAGFFIPKMVDERREKLGSSRELGVFEETAKLKTVLMWGAPGAETALGQLLPKDVSCFEEEFDVPKARKEFEDAKAILERNGVEIIQVKDLFAKMIEDKGIEPEITIDQLKVAVMSKACELYKEYPEQDPKKFEDVLCWVDEAIDSDAKKYGEKVAIVINQRLSLSNKLPMANVLYARDQSNLLGNTLVWSSMRHEIRQPEVELFKEVLSHSGIYEEGAIKKVQVTGEGRFEGGDGIVSGGICYIGVGGRTNMKGIIQVANSILDDGLRLMVPIDIDRDLHLLPEMDTMHLDTMWMPFEENGTVACMREVDRRRLWEIKRIADGKLTVIDQGTFAEHMAERGMDIVQIDKDAQKGYAPNLLNLGNKKVVLSRSDTNNLTEELAEKGISSEDAALQETTKGFGGLHCMTASISRG